ncbi:MAG: HAD family hydrolase [Candidatus Nanoarchaeia archaeon]
MAKIKLVAWDVYGTLIESSGDETKDVPELEKSRLRPNALEALALINSKKILQVTSSDAPNDYVKLSLEKQGINWTDYFNGIYNLTSIPKDYTNILEKYNIKPENLLVIGDNKYYDLSRAKEQGCQILWVPENEVGFSELPLEEIEKILQ